jgi:hypothetical protein
LQTPSSLVSLAEAEYWRWLNERPNSVLLVKGTEQVSASENDQDGFVENGELDPDGVNHSFWESLVGGVSGAPEHPSPKSRLVRMDSADASAISCIIVSQ